jgi:hypothetical protein
MSNIDIQVRNLIKLGNWTFCVHRLDIMKKMNSQYSISNVQGRNLIKLGNWIFCIHRLIIQKK